MPDENRETLLAKVVPVFASSTEDVAVEALGHILSESEATRRTLSDILHVGGAAVGQIARVRTQPTGGEDERPDLAGFDQHGRERVLIEAKFWAGLTANQPLTYLERLPEQEPSALLFVAPAARIEPLWTELHRRVSKSSSGITLESFQEAEMLRSAAAGGARRLMLTSWKNLLARMAAAAGAAADSHTETDIRQLQGLTVREDTGAFLPLRPEEFGPEFPRRMLRLRELVDDVTERGVQAGWADWSRVQVQDWGYGRYLGLGGEDVWFGINFYDWARHRDTPLWLWFYTARVDVEKVRRALESPRRQSPPEVLPSDWGLVVPIELPVAVEYEAVLDAVVARLAEIAAILSESRE